ncbi:MULTISPECIES: hypothetical protein [Streptomyces]|uniref:Helix-turn-helix domain-containing protein n=3 Tax=Streptomyces TaxID=1883 RepID=A0ABU2QS29_9ACTN|nr:MULTISPECIES: hypothetical protein [unclassified Streptomyces]MDT0399923.1 hypothetical protein [Streptomyces sp. DSM 41636]MDT0406816.1 hypothetical protein [Streptomyces sp. DSM 41635]MDT0550402.1 hypothetical protein [Streptomyces sp. DSM 41529]WSD57460.1 hypothetical protein OHA76_32240 [Streptomyces albidoflavus]
MEHEVTPGEIRAAAEAELTPVGRRRIRLLAQLEECEAELRPLVARALRAEVSYRRISSLTGLSPATIRSWTKRSGEAPGT